MSKSHSDLRLHDNDKLQHWDWESGPELKDTTPAKSKGPLPYAAGESPLEKLPAEVLGRNSDSLCWAKDLWEVFVR